jgi:hypothetical protein
VLSLRTQMDLPLGTAGHILGGESGRPAQRNEVQMLGMSGSPGAVDAVFQPGRNLTKPLNTDRAVAGCCAFSQR